MARAKTLSVRAPLVEESGLIQSLHTCAAITQQEINVINAMAKKKHYSKKSMSSMQWQRKTKSICFQKPLFVEVAFTTEMKTHAKHWGMPSRAQEGASVTGRHDIIDAAFK
eukprot:6201334-Pleurochrysis_carterae.AAC.4